MGLIMGTRINVSKQCESGFVRVLLIAYVIEMGLLRQKAFFYQRVCY